MSLKRILGMMLAARLGGRGRRGGSLGSAAMMGMLGGRRRGMGGKLGLAAMGYMAYRAYQDNQARTGRATGAGSGTGGGAGGQGGIGGIGGMIRDVADRFTGGAISGGQPGGQPGTASDFRDEERAAAEFSDDKALLLIRAMVTAAYSDGALSEAERARIMGELEGPGADAEDRRILEREIANPKPLDELLAQVHDQETAEEFYLASRAAIDGETEQNRAYLAKLRQRLGLSEQDAAEVEQLAF